MEAPALRSDSQHAGPRGHAEAVTLKGSLLFRNFEPFFESFVVEDQFDLLIAGSFSCFAFATAAAEFDFGTGNGYRLSRINRLAGEGAFDLLGFAGGDQLQIGFGSKLFGVCGESFLAVAAAECNCGAFVFGCAFGVNRFTGNGADGFAISGKGLADKCEHSQ